MDDYDDYNHQVILGKRFSLNAHFHQIIQEFEHVV